MSLSFEQERMMRAAQRAEVQARAPAASAVASTEPASGQDVANLADLAPAVAPMSRPPNRHYGKPVPKRRGRKVLRDNMYALLK